MFAVGSMVRTKRDETIPLSGTTKQFVVPEGHKGTVVWSHPDSSEVEVQLDLIEGVAIEEFEEPWMYLESELV